MTAPVALYNDNQRLAEVFIGGLFYSENVREPPLFQVSDL